MVGAHVFPPRSVDSALPLVSERQCHFEKNVSVYIKKDDRDPACCTLKLTLTSDKHLGSRNVLIQLNDPDDYLFQLTSILGEEVCTEVGML